MVTEFSPRILDILEKNKERIFESVVGAAANRLTLIQLLKVNELEREGDEETNSQVSYLINLFDVYINTVGNSQRRLDRIDLFAENYQISPEKVKEDLRYFGLRI